jgi:hypothetical protein
MKLAIFAAAVVVAYFVGRSLRSSPLIQRFLWGVVGFLPLTNQPDLGMVADSAHAGHAHGIEGSLLDLVVVVLFAAHTGPRRRAPYRLLIAFYFLAEAASVAQAPHWLPATYAVWNLSRFCFLYFVLSWALDDEGVPPAILRGMCVGVALQLGYVFWQKAVLGLPRAIGTFDHQNMLGMAVNLVVMVPFAVLLARKVDWLTLLTPLFGVIIVVLTLSRGAVIFYFVGLLGVYLLSLARRLTPRKLAVAATGFSALLAVSAEAVPRVVKRFETAHAGSMETREAFVRAAKEMVAAHPMGVGTNHFSYAMLHLGFGELAGVDWVNRSAVVHNIYWLATAELGYFGLAALLALCLIPAESALWHAVRSRDDVRGDVLLGIGVAMAVVAIHGLVEWVLRSTDVAYLWWMMLALSGSLVRQLRERPAGNAAYMGEGRS